MKTGDSTETLGSVEKAALRRVRTVDMLATPLSYAPTVKSPKSPTLSTAPTVDFKNNDSSQDETPTTNSASEKDVEKTSAAEAKVKSKSKGKTAKEKVACRTTPKKPSAQFMRMKKHLDEAKLKRLEREAEESKTSKTIKTSKTSKTSKISKTRPKAAAAKAKGKISLNKKVLSLQPTKDKGSPSKKGRHEKGNENRKDEAADPGETSHKSEATAKKSHAMYMKYWRSIKSTEVAIYIFFCDPADNHKFIKKTYSMDIMFEITASSSGRNTPKEVKKLARRFRWCQILRFFLNTRCVHVDTHHT